MKLFVKRSVVFYEQADAVLKTKEAVLRVLESPSEHIGISYSNHSSKVSTTIWKNKTEPATPGSTTLLRQPQLIMD